MILYHNYSKSSEAEKDSFDLEALKALLMKDNIVKMEVLARQKMGFVDGLEKAARHPPGRPRHYGYNR